MVIEQYNHEFVLVAILSESSPSMYKNNLYKKKDKYLLPCLVTGKVHTLKPWPLQQASASTLP